MTDPSYFILCDHGPDINPRREWIARDADATRGGLVRDIVYGEIDACGIVKILEVIPPQGFDFETLEPPQEGKSFDVTEDIARECYDLIKHDPTFSLSEHPKLAEWFTWTRS